VRATASSAIVLRRRRLQRLQHAALRRCGVEEAGGGGLQRLRLAGDAEQGLLQRGPLQLDARDGGGQLAGQRGEIHRTEGAAAAAAKERRFRKKVFTRRSSP